MSEIFAEDNQKVPGSEQSRSKTAQSKAGWNKTMTTCISIGQQQRNLIAMLAAMTLLGTLAGTVQAGAPSAIVEDVSARSVETRVFDYLSAGDVLELGPSDALILGYLNSCLREIITGGRVTIGETQSQVEDGSVVRETVDCHGGAMDLSATEATQGGGFVLRSPVTAANYKQ